MTENKRVRHFVASEPLDNDGDFYCLIEIKNVDNFNSYPLASDEFKLIEFSEVERLNEINKWQRSELDKWNDWKPVLTKQIEELKQVTDDAKVACMNYKDKFQDTESKLQSLESELNEVKTTNIQLADLNEEIKKSHYKALAKLQDIENEIRELKESEIEEYKENAAHQRENARLEYENKELKEKLLYHDKIVDHNIDLNIKINAFESENQLLKKKLEKCKNENK